jgi:hypothetical protein
MAALVVVNMLHEECRERTGSRVAIFPGGLTPSMLPANTPFWIGYGFVSAPGDLDGGPGFLPADTRFELDVDGARVSMTTDLQQDGRTPDRKTDFVNFPYGLPAGWHDFVGRWYDDGTLILSSRNTIEFVERAT